MISYAETYLTITEDGETRHDVFTNDRDFALQAIVRERGYRKTEHDEPMSHFSIPDPFPAITLPEGFRLWPKRTAFASCTGCFTAASITVTSGLRRH